MMNKNTEKIWFTCFLCGDYYDTQEGLDEHLDQHAKEGGVWVTLQN